MTDDLRDLAAAVDEAAPPATSTPDTAPAKSPSEYQGSDTARTINDLIGSLTGEPDLVRKVRLGESACATLETAGLDSRIAPQWWLLGAIVAIAAVTLWKRTHNPAPTPANPTGFPEVPDANPAP